MTAFSNVVREGKDFACAIMAPDCRTVAQSSQSVPVFLGTMTHTLHAILEIMDLSDFQPGDVVGTNDPWHGTGQLNDLTVFTPLFVKNQLVAFAGVVAHISDIGGVGLSEATQVFDEGLRIPIMKVADPSGVHPTLAEIIRANVRQPNEALGDINAMLNSAAVIETGLSQLCEEMSVTKLSSIWTEVESRTEQYMRSAIAAIPDGSYEANFASEGGPAVPPYTIALRVEVSGDRLLLDFEGSSRQVAVGINSPLSYSQAYAIYACKCLLAADLPFNEGILRPVTVRAPNGTVVNSEFPAAGSGRSMVGHFIPALVYEALEPCLPERVIGECGAPRPFFTIRGSDPATGSLFSALCAAAGGFGARSGKDGISCLNFPTNVEALPIEVLESSYPVLIEAKELVTDSGGPGRFRGGLGQRLSIRCLADGEAHVRAQWLSQAPRGVRGGGNGGRARVVLNDQQVGGLAGPQTLAPGDVLTIESPGGGGFGPAELRDRDLIEADVRNGYVSEECARAVYGLEP